MKTISRIILIAFPLVLSAQPPDTLWSRTYGGSGNEDNYAICRTADGGYVLGGSTTSFGHGGDMWLVKTDAQGDTLWTRTYGGIYNEICYDVRQTSDGGYILAGGTGTYGPGEPGQHWHYWLLKTDANGDSLWSRTFGGIHHSVGRSVRQTTDGGYITGGEWIRWIDNFQREGVWMIRTDSEGDSLWGYSFSHNIDPFGWGGFYYARGARQTSDGGFISFGYHSSGEDPWGFRGVWVMKTNAVGDSLWTAYYYGRGSSYCTCAPTDDGGFIVGAQRDHGLLLLKADVDGNEEWSRTYWEGLSHYTNCQSVCPTSDGGYVLAGIARGDLIPCNIVILKADASGDSIWCSTFGREGNENGGFVVEAADSGYTVASSWYSTSEADGLQFLLMKLGPDPVSVEEERMPSAAPSAFQFSAYPNPFNPVTTLQFQLGRPDRVRLTVYDLTGRLITVLADDFYPSGSHEVSWNAGEQPSGIYFAVLQNGSQTETQKLLLIK